MKLRVRIGDNTYVVEIGDLYKKPILTTVDGETFEIWLEEAETKPTSTSTVAGIKKKSAPTTPPQTERPAQGFSNTKKSNAVIAPIPGVILSISVKVGEQVEVGQELCILEAMKMNNLIRAGRSGKISAIHISNGDNVQHNQVLMEYSD